MNSNTITIIFARSSVAMVNSVQICYNMIQRAFFTEPAYMQHICCGTVSNIAREGEEAHVMTLKELRDTQVDMFTTVFIGNSQTKEINNKMVTPRGYRNV